MKKIIAVLLTVCIAAAVFAACTNNNNPEPDETTGNPLSTSTITTDEAIITNDNAIKLISSYSAEELSISDEDMANCTFMHKSSGIEIDGKYYVEVDAAVPVSHTDENGETSYTFDTKGQYFIRYDGKQVLKRDMTSEEDKYDELEVKELPSSDAQTEEVSE